MLIISTLALFQGYEAIESKKIGLEKDSYLIYRIETSLNEKPYCTNKIQNIAVRCVV